MLVSIILAIIIGILAGGVVNALSDDLPLRRKPRLPRYVPISKKMAVHFRPTEENPKPPVDPQEDDERRPLIAWLGITAFLFGKRTSSDGTVTLNWRYPLTEIFTAFLMVLTVTATYNEPDMSIIQLIYWLGYMGILSLITIIDVEHKLILFVVIIPSCGFAFSDAVITQISGSINLVMSDPSLLDSVIGGIAGFVVFFLMYNGGFLFTYVMGKVQGQSINEVAFGYGDVMLATLSGLMLGWQALIFAIFITVFLGAFGALIYIATRAILGQKYSAYTALPYGPYIVAGTIIMLLYHSEVGKILGGT